MKRTKEDFREAMRERCDHETTMKGSVLFKRILVLLVAQQGESVLLFPRDAGFRRDVFDGLDHGVLGVGITVEVVPHPLLTLALASGTERVGVIDVWPIAVTLLPEL